jgi:catalase-peroxidase
MTEDSNNRVTGGVKRPSAGKGMSNRDWWPNQLNLKVLH